MRYGCSETFAFPESVSPRQVQIEARLEDVRRREAEGRQSFFEAPENVSTRQRLRHREPENEELEEEGTATQRSETA